MAFGSFVESVIETPICCELKQRLDKLYEFYTETPEKIKLARPTRESAKNRFMILLPLLMEIYEGFNLSEIPDHEWEAVTDKNKNLKEVHKSNTICPMCEYKDSPFMPCNACDDLGSEFKFNKSLRETAN